MGDVKKFIGFDPDETGLKLKLFQESLKLTNKENIEYIKKVKIGDSYRYTLCFLEEKIGKYTLKELKI